MHTIETGGVAGPQSGKPVIVTTSWDDGDARDLRVVEALVERQLCGTFYCPVKPYNDKPAVTKADMREMVSQGLEVGAHGISHEIMTDTPAERLDAIVSGCKAYLEDALGGAVPMFCYPRGRYTRQAVQALRRAGYEGARTIRMFATDTVVDAFKLPTTMQACPHSRTQYFRNIIRARKPQHLMDYALRLRMDRDWVILSTILFDRVLAHGGVWHLWGHSWELDELNLWDQLAQVLDHVAHRQGVLYLNNNQLVRYLSPGQ